MTIPSGIVSPIASYKQSQTPNNMTIPSVPVGYTSSIGQVVDGVSPLRPVTSNQVPTRAWEALPTSCTALVEGYAAALAAPGAAAQGGGWNSQAAVPTMPMGSQTFGRLLSRMKITNYCGPYG